MAKMISLTVFGIFVTFAAYAHGQNETCQEGYTLIDHSCYLPSIQQLSWTMALRYCSDRGAEMATIETCEEYAVLLTDLFTLNGVLHQPGNFWYWTSGGDFITEGKWIWYSNGSPFNCTALWSPGQPITGTNGPDYNCYAFGLNNGKFEGSSHDCNINYNTYMHFALCETPVQKHA